MTIPGAAAVTELTITRLREALSYDRGTGIFIWRISRPGLARASGVAGWNNGMGYITVSLDGKNYKAHRLAFFYMTGKWPEHDVDHADTNKSNNSWANLREATRSQNRANTCVRSDNTSGYKGVTWDNRRQKWRAQTMVRGKRLYLGLFDRIENAATAYLFAAHCNFGEFARAA